MDPGERRLVATMPLHAITSTYGEQGLRARFEAEIEAWPGEERRRLNQGLELAARLHAADRREREPYVNHLLRVAIRIMSHYGVHDADVVIAALLHDAVEDHAAELAPGGGPRDALAVLAAEFGPRVAELVAAVTNPRVRAGPRRPPAVPGARRGQPAAQPVGAGHQGLRLHRQRRRPDPHHRPSGAHAGRQVRAACPGPARADRAPRHPARRRGQGAHPGPARPGRGQVRGRPG